MAFRAPGRCCPPGHLAAKSLPLLPQAAFQGQAILAGCIERNPGIQRIQKCPQNPLVAPAFPRRATRRIPGPRRTPGWIPGPWPARDSGPASSTIVSPPVRSRASQVGPWGRCQQRVSHTLRRSDLVSDITCVLPSGFSQFFQKSLFLQDGNAQVGGLRQLAPGLFSGHQNIGFLADTAGDLSAQ